MDQLPPNSSPTPFVLTSDSVVEEIQEVKPRRKSFDPARLDQLAQPKHWPKSQKFNDGKGKNKIDGKQTQIVIAQNVEVNSTNPEPKTKTLRELPNNADFSQNTPSDKDKDKDKNERPSAEKKEKPKNPANDTKSKSGILNPVPIVKKDGPPVVSDTANTASKSQSRPRVDMRRKSNPPFTSQKPPPVQKPPNSNAQPQPRRQSMDPAFSSTYQNPTKSWAAKRPLSNLTARPVNAQQQQQINIPSPKPASEDHKKLVDPLEFLVAAHIGELMNRRADGTYGSKPWQTFVSTLYRNFVISIDVTGYNLESIKTSVEGRQLTVEGEQVEEGTSVSHVNVPGSGSENDDQQQQKKKKKEKHGQDEGPKELRYIRRVNFTQHIIPIPRGFSTTDLKIGLDDLLGFVIIVGHIENHHDINTNTNLTVLPVDAGLNGNHMVRGGSSNDPLIAKWKKDLAGPQQNHQVNQHQQQQQHDGAYHQQGKISPLNTVLDQYKPKPREEDRRTSTLAKLDPKTRSRIRIASDMEPELPHHEPKKLLENREPISFWDKKHLVRAAKYSNEPDHEHPHHPHHKRHHKTTDRNEQTDDGELNDDDFSSTSFTDDDNEERVKENEVQKGDKTRMKEKKEKANHSEEDRIVPAPMEKHPVVFSSIETSTPNPTAGPKNKVIGTKYRRPSSATGQSSAKRKLKVRKSSTASNNSKKLLGGGPDGPNGGESEKFKHKVNGKKIVKSHRSKNSETLVALTQAKNLLEGVKFNNGKSHEVKSKSKTGSKASLPANKAAKTLPDTPSMGIGRKTSRNQNNEAKNQVPPFAFLSDKKASADKTKIVELRPTKSFEGKRNRGSRDLTEDLDFQRSFDIVSNMNFVPLLPAHRRRHKHHQDQEENSEVPLLSNPGKIDLKNDLKSQLMDQISSSNFEIASPENLSMSLSHSSSNYVPIYAATIAQSSAPAGVRNQLEFNNNRCKEVTFDQNDPKVIIVASEPSEDGFGIFTGNQIQLHPRILGIDLDRNVSELNRDSESTEALQSSSNEGSTDASFADISSGYNSSNEKIQNQNEVPLAKQTINEDEEQYEETDYDSEDFEMFKSQVEDDASFSEETQDLLKMLEDSEKVLEIDLPVVDETNEENMEENEEESKSEVEVKVGEFKNKEEPPYKTLRVKLTLPKKHHSLH